MWGEGRGEGLGDPPITPNPLPRSHVFPKFTSIAVERE